MRRPSRRRRRAVPRLSALGVVAVLATVPATAHAAGSLTASGGQITMTVAAAVPNEIRVDQNGATITVTGVELTPSGGCSGSAGTYSCPAGRLTANLSSGNDTLAIVTTGGGTVEGNPGADLVRINGASGGWTVRGGDGDDTVESGAGSDTLEGGPGADTLDYSGRSAGVSVTLAGGSDDGAPGENDKLSGFEDVIGTDFDDVLVGDGNPNVLGGRSGADRITGGGRLDLLLGGDGNDEILADDGGPDGVDCQEGTDTGRADSVDELSDCEGFQIRPTATTDADGDGVKAPEDCNDGDPSIRPGASEVADDGIDQDCDGADLIDLDRDKDGIRRPQDCDDRNPARRPGTPELPGNTVDENCDGKAEPFPTLRADLNLRGATFATFTRVTTLRLSGLVKGDRITATCRGGGCRKGKLTRTASDRRMDLLSFVRRRKLRGGAVLTVTVAAKTGVTKRFRYEFSRGAPPLRILRCSSPPDNADRRC